MKIGTWSDTQVWSATASWLAFGRPKKVKKEKEPEDAPPKKKQKVEEEEKKKEEKKEEGLKKMKVFLKLTLKKTKRVNAPFASTRRLTQ